MRLFIEALKYAMALKADDAERRRVSKVRARREARAKQRVMELAQAHPHLIKVEIHQDGGEWWALRYAQYRVDLALRAYPNGRAASTKLTRAVHTFLMELGELPPATIAPVMLALVARVVRVTRPSGLEAAVLSVMAGTEAEAREPNQQAEAERRWRARFRSPETNAIARAALLDHAIGERHALVFEDGKLVPRRGRQTGQPTD